MSVREDNGVYWIGDVDAARFVANADNSDVYRLQEGLSNAIENLQIDNVPPRLAGNNASGQRRLRQSSPPEREQKDALNGFLPMTIRS